MTTTNPLAEMIKYTTECRTINPKSIDAHKYKAMCENLNCYEIIPDDRKIKPYFDIEIKPKHCVDEQEYNDVWEDIAKIAIGQILHHFNDPEIAILNASSANFKSCQTDQDTWIISIHLIISNYKISKKQNLSIVSLINKTLNSKKYNGDKVSDYFELTDPDTFELFDDSVYDKDRKIRSAYANKTHWIKDTPLKVETRPLIIENGTFEQSVISAFFDEKFTIIDDLVDLEHTFKPICISPVTVAVDLDLTECNSEISKLLAVIGSARCSDGKHSEWNSVAQAIKNETKDDGLSDFVNWTNKYGTENKKKEAIVQYQKHIKYTPKSNKKRLTLGSLHYWARQDNPNGYVIAFPKTVPTLDVGIKSQWYDEIDNCIFDVADYDYAMLFNKFYKGQFVCVEKLKKEYYYFDEQKLLWQYDNGGTPIRNKISTDLFNEFANYQKTVLDKVKALDPNADKDEREQLCGKVKKVADIMIKLRKTGDKNNILCEISDICKDTDFPTTLNKSEYFLPTNDGKILNMKTLLVSDRTIEHKFSFQCNAKLIPFDSSCNQCINDSYTKVDTYFNDLFCGNAHTKQCVINILKSVFIGRPLRYIYFCIGNGNNGKSLLFSILNKIFGNFMDTISESVIIEQKGNKSALNTEIEKLDKCRLGYVTELKEIDKLNEKVIKQISGGDAINLRTLHTKDHTINPTCNAFVLTNEMPSFNGEAKSMLKRIITIPFKGDFETNINFEKDMLDLSDYIFSYIMNNGVILDKFNLSDEMIEESNKHSKNNTETTLEDYLNEHLIDCVNDKKENKLIVLNDLRIAFENDCAVNKLKNSLTQKKFTTKIKSLGLIVKETNGKTRLYGKKFKDTELE
jgi:phage/plasmid-associated DNA primase